MNDTDRRVLFPIDCGNRYNTCGHALVLPEHIPFLSRFSWRLVDGIAITRIGLREDVNMEELIAHPELGNDADGIN